jgi:putative cardiolipin synthase
MEAFTARIAIIEHAERSLDVQYYIWHDDLTGKVLQSRLLHAGNRGVRVRLLLDDLDTAGKEETLHKIDSHPNIEIRLFNPFANRNVRALDFASDLSRVNHRMHNKSLTADNQASILGGRNIGDEYFDATGGVAFTDLDVLAIGPVVKEVSAAFDLYWNSPWVYPLSAFGDDTGAAVENTQLLDLEQALNESSDEARKSAYGEVLRQSNIIKLTDDLGEQDYSWGKWFLVRDDPSKVIADEVKIETHLGPQLAEALGNADKEIIVISPYFVPGEKITEFFNELVEKGIRVRILTNSLAANDVPLVHAGYMRYRKDLVAGGVELYEYKPTKNGEKPKKEKKRWVGSSQASLHAKSFNFDRQFLFVGSFNLDGRSIAINTEMGVFFESPKYAEMMAGNFDEQLLTRAYRIDLNDGDLAWVTLENGEEVSFDVEPETSWWTRFKTGVLSIFVIESQL